MTRTTTRSTPTTTTSTKTCAVALLVNEDGSCVETLTEDSSAHSSSSVTEQTSSMAEQNSSSASHPSIEEMHDALEETGDRAALRADPLLPEGTPGHAASSAGPSMETPSGNAVHYDLDEDELDAAAVSSAFPPTSRRRLESLWICLALQLEHRSRVARPAGYNRMKTAEAL